MPRRIQIHVRSRKRSATRLKLIISAALLIPIPLLGQERPTANGGPSVTVCTKAEGIPPEDPVTRGFSAYRFSVGSRSYTLDNSGFGNRGAGTTHPIKFHVSIPAANSIVRVHACDFKGNLLLSVEFTDEESGGGLVALLDARSLTTIWNADIPAFNVAVPVLEGGAGYVSGIGFVGRLDLRTGRYRWRYAWFYDGDGYNSFKPAELEGTRVIFRDGDKPDVVQPIIIDKRTGRILTPETVRQRILHPRKPSCGEYAAPRPC